MSKVQFDYNKLKGKIVEVYGTREAFAEALNMAKGTLSMKLNNKCGIKTGEILIWSSMLKIPSEEIGSYFFNARV